MMRAVEDQPLDRDGGVAAVDDGPDEVGADPTVVEPDRDAHATRSEQRGKEGEYLRHLRGSFRSCATFVQRSCRSADRDGVADADDPFADDACGHAAPAGVEPMLDPCKL